MAAIGAFACTLSQLPGRHMAENQRVRVVGFGDSDRGASAGGFADRWIERHLPERFDAEPFGFQGDAAAKRSR
ncbi:MAG TPA: hypothetical protein VHT52_02585, partial [Stellaceae bacterium]|nr:hypothetical protein [Stellaceae bacterium]